MAENGAVSTEQPLADTAYSGDSTARRILVLGGTGTIGRATVAALVARGHQVVCIARPKAGVGRKLTEEKTTELLHGSQVCFGDITDAEFLREQVFGDRPFDAVVSCLASRTGEPKDAWAIDYQAHANVLALAKQSGVTQMVLLSAICVQKPLLVFQHAKLAFEKDLIESGLTYSIVRPTAFFKSLAAQVEQVKKGSPFFLFGDGTLTACKPISDADLAAYIADCLDDPARHNQILPIGGPGPALTQREQGECLFELLEREPRFISVPDSLLSCVANAMAAIGKVIPPVADKAELARIGHYYATESMLLLNPETGQYDAEATPETGTETLKDYFQRLVDGRETAERVDVAMFSDS
ncbi:MAG: NAD(P)H-binding protein [Cyanobacteria bacterium P01_G01_bin.54]